MSAWLHIWLNDIIKHGKRAHNFDYVWGCLCSKVGCRKRILRNFTNFLTLLIFDTFISLIIIMECLKKYCITQEARTTMLVTCLIDNFKSWAKTSLRKFQLSSADEFIFRWQTHLYIYFGVIPNEGESTCILVRNEDSRGASVLSSCLYGNLLLHY